MRLFQKKIPIHTTYREKIQKNEQIEIQKISQISETAKRMDKSGIEYVYMKNSVKCYKKKHPINMI